MTGGWRLWTLLKWLAISCVVRLGSPSVWIAQNGQSTSESIALGWWVKTWLDKDDSVKPNWPHTEQVKLWTEYLVELFKKISNQIKGTIK